MATEYQILILLVCIVAAAVFVHHLHAKSDETAESVFWANIAQPLIFEQPAATIEAQQATKALYQSAVSNLKKHGNRWIKKTDVHLWLWGADNENTSADFQMWALLNAKRRMDTHERFRSEKAAKAARASAVPGIADIYAGIQDFEDVQKSNK